MLFIIFSRNISKSIDEIVRAAGQIAKGDFSGKAIVYSQDEIGALAGSFNNMTTFDISKCHAVGMDDYLTKPIDEKLLYSKIITLVNKF